MNTKALIMIILFLVILGGGYTIFAGGQTQSPIPQKVEETKKTVEEKSQSLDSKMKSFVVSGKPFEFSMKEIRVKQGDTVKIVFKNTEGFHDLTVDGLNVKTKQIQAGQEDTIQFVADKTGSFEYYCSVGTHRQMGMVGMLIVE